MVVCENLKDAEQYESGWGNMTFELSREEIMAVLFGVDMARGKDLSVEYSGQPEFIQVRRHKKKRINKKWAKRYGYNAVINHYSIKNCKVYPNGILSEGVEIVC